MDFNEQTRAMMIANQRTIKTSLLYCCVACCAFLFAGCGSVLHVSHPPIGNKSPIAQKLEATVSRKEVLSASLTLPPPPAATLHGCAWDWYPTNSLAGKYWQVWASNDLTNWRVVTNTLWPHYLAVADKPCEFYKVCTVDSLGRQGWAMKGTQQ